VSGVVPRQGYCQVHVVELPEPLIENRLQVLQAVAAEGISIDFLKLTPHGLSFVATADRAEDLKRVFSSGGYKATVGVGRTILSVHAVNIRDEEGLIAEVLREAISLGAQIDHVGDGHDRLLLVVGDADASRIQKHFESKIK
jgi:aspartate kinase